MTQPHARQRLKRLIGSTFFVAVTGWPNCARPQELVALHTVPIALPDPSFEQGDHHTFFAPTAGQPVNGLQPASDTARTGKGSMTARGPIPTWAGFFTQPQPVSPGTRLQFEAWIKAEKAGGLATLSINWNDGGKYLRHVAAENAVGTHGWKRVVLTTTVPQDANHYVLGLRVDGLTGQVWYDDVALYRLVPQSAHGGRYLFSEDFDTDPLPDKRWTFGRGGKCEYAYDTQERFRGNGCLRAGPGDAMWGRWFSQQRLRVRPGYRYRLSGYIKTSGVRHGVPSLGLGFFKGDQRLDGISTRNVYEPDWTPVEAEGAAPREAEWAQVTCEASGLEGVAWFDALQVFESPQPGVWIDRLQVTGSPHGLLPGHDLAGEVVILNPLKSRRLLELHWTLTDVEGNLLWQRKETVSLHNKATVRAHAGRQKKLGYFHLKLEVFENGLRLGGATRNVPVLPPLPVKPMPHVPYTVIAANQYSLVKGALTEEEATWRRFARMMRASGVTNLRVWNHWTEQNYPPGSQGGDGVVLKPSVYDMACRVAREEGIRVSMVFWLVPPWAQGPEEDWHCYRFTQEAAKYYAKVGVDRFEIDNEPVGTQRYLDRLKAGYLGIKRGNPSAEALMAGLFWYHRRPNEGMFTLDGNLFNALGELAAPYTDRVNWHEYYQSPPEQPLSRDLAVHRDLCDRRFAGSYGTSLYMTETAYCAFSPGPAGHVTEQQQAEWGVREYLVTLRDNYLDMDNKAFWYYYLDDNGAPYYAAAMSGLLRIDMSPKPSYLAMRNLAPLIEGAEPVGEIEVGEPFKALLLRRGAEPVIAVWSAGEPGDIAIDVGRRQVTLIDLWGNTRQAVTHEGKLGVRLTGSPQYVLGADAATVFAPALANQLTRLRTELRALGWAAAEPTLQQVSETIPVLLETHKFSALPSLADSAEKMVDETVEDLASGKLTMREAGPRFALLRVADTCRVGGVLVGERKEQTGQAIAGAELLERQATEALGSLSGQTRARIFVQLGQRRLERVRWQQKRGWDSAVNTETARLAARDFRLALQLARLEPNPRLDVWLSSPAYELRATGKAVEFPVAVHNAFESSIEGQFLINAPAGWRIETDQTRFQVAPQQRLVVACRATPEAITRGLSVLRLAARIGDREILPIAFQLEASVPISVRWQAAENAINVEIHNHSDQQLPEQVFIANWVSPGYVTLPPIPAGSSLALRLQAPEGFRAEAKSLPCKLESPELHWQGEAERNDTSIQEARPVTGNATVTPTGPWLVVGPFDNPQEVAGVALHPDKGHEIDYLYEHGGETAIVPTPKMTYTSTVASGGIAAWQTYSGNGEWVDLEAVFGKTDYRVAYMATTLHSEESQLVVLETGSDDGLKVYHDGRKVWDFCERRSAARAENKTVVRLHPGENRFLLKCFDAQGEWVLSFRAVATARVSSAE
ncbi:MAG: hypothetical protein HY318_05145 [Armatimonadetes bacterium]|nr:hypothetical protein [Armatimonadota bacterium]